MEPRQSWPRWDEVNRKKRGDCDKKEALACPRWWFQSVKFSCHPMSARFSQEAVRGWRVGVVVGLDLFVYNAYGRFPLLHFLRLPLWRFHAVHCVCDQSGKVAFPLPSGWWNLFFSAKVCWFNLFLIEDSGSLSFWREWLPSPEHQFPPAVHTGLSCHYTANQFNY